MVAYDDSINMNNKNKMLVNKHSKKLNMNDIDGIENPFFLNMMCRGNCCCPPPTLKKDKNNESTKKQDVIENKKIKN